MTTKKTTSHQIEYEGRTYLVQKRVSQFSDGQFLTHYSMDGGAGWHSELVGAYKQAQEDGLLTVVGEPLTADGEFEAFMAGLISEIVALGVGERLTLVRTETEIVAVREQAKLSVRASTVRDVELKIQEDENADRAGL